MSTTFYIRYYDTQHDEQQPEGSRNQTKAAQRADLLHNNRSAANSLAQTIDAASSSTQEAQVESTVSPTPLCERRSQPESAAGKPTPLSAPQAGIFRSGPRATRFGAAALLSSLGCRSCCSQQRSSSSACRSRACERACFSQQLLASDFLLPFFFDFYAVCRQSEASASRAWRLRFGAGSARRRAVSREARGRIRAIAVLTRGSDLHGHLLVALPPPRRGSTMHSGAAIALSGCSCRRLPWAVGVLVDERPRISTY